MAGMVLTCTEIPTYSEGLEVAEDLLVNSPVHIVSVADSKFFLVL